jgi:uncharacterized repeat protein (TIGR03803 family)
MPRTVLIGLGKSLLTLIMTLIPVTVAVAAAKEKVLYSFTGGGDGGIPFAGLTPDKAGDLYGTTWHGGHFGGVCSTAGCGTVFKLDNAGHETVVHSFTGGRDGGFPRLLLFSNGRILIECGIVRGGQPSTGAARRLTAPPNIRVSNRACRDASSCTKSESMVSASTKNKGKTIVVNYNDHNPTAGTYVYGGTSYSTDGGAHFKEIQPPPFATGHGDNLGDPIVVFNSKLNKWFAGDLVGSLSQSSDCVRDGGASGELGIALWTSTDGIHWKAGACPHIGVSDDRESMWADNEPTSGKYGRMYISWVDYGNNADLSVVYSDNGVNWTGPVILNNGNTFIRDVQITGSPRGAKLVQGKNSSVFVAGMDEGGGGNATRQNLMYKSLDGGATWASTVMGPRFNPPGDGFCDNPYFYKVNPIIRHMGWGEPAVGPKGVVHYVYAGAGTNGDTGDIFYQRSKDNGKTWSKPVKLNTDKDAPNKTQWMPSLSATSDGNITAAWYDRRKATSACNSVTDPGCNYERVGRQSKTNGASWLAEIAISTHVIPQPAQDDGGVQACYAGDYDYNTALSGADSSGNGSAYVTWTDGRRSVGGTHVQDVDFAKVPLP